MILKKPILIFCAAGFLSACGADRADTMAADMCSCMRQMADSFEEIETRAGQEGTPELMQEALEKMEAATAATEECLNGLEEKYGDRLELEEEAIRRRMSERCPQVARFMERSLEETD